MAAAVHGPPPCLNHYRASALPALRVGRQVACDWVPASVQTCRWAPKKHNTAAHIVSAANHHLWRRTLPLMHESMRLKVFTHAANNSNPAVCLDITGEISKNIFGHSFTPLPIVYIIIVARDCVAIENERRRRPVGRSAAACTPPSPSAGRPGARACARGAARRRGTGEARCRRRSR